MRGTGSKIKGKERKEHSPRYSVTSPWSLSTYTQHKHHRKHDIIWYQKHHNSYYMSPNRGAVPATWAEPIGCLSLSADVYWKERHISLSRCWFLKLLFFSGGDGQDPEIDTFIPDTLKAAESRPRQCLKPGCHMKRAPVLVHSPSEMLGLTVSAKTGEKKHRITI